MAALRSGRRVRLLLSAAVVAVSTLAAAGPVQASARADGGGSQDLAQDVNPFVGTKPGGPDFGTGGGAGNTFPGADVPFGMVQWSPDTKRDQPGGYYYDDSQIRGFSLTHLSGAGCDGDEDLPFMPYAGAVTTSPASDPARYLDSFSHNDESATAGYYGVKLASGNKVELTATQRSGAGRFSFPAASTASLLVNVSGSIGGASDAQATITGDRTITGYVASGHFCGGDNLYRLYFSAAFDQPFASVGTWHNDIVTPGDQSVRGGARAKVDTRAQAKSTSATTSAVSGTKSARATHPSVGPAPERTSPSTRRNRPPWA